MEVQESAPAPSARATDHTSEVAAAGSPETATKASASTTFRVPAAGANAVHAAGPITITLASQIGVAVEMIGDALKVRNASEIATSVRVTVITRRESRHVVNVLELDSGLQQTIFLDALRPPLIEPEDIVRAEVIALNSARARPIHLEPSPPH